MAYARLATRNTSGLHPNLRGMGFLGDSPAVLSPSDAMQQAIQFSTNAGLKLNPRDFQNSSWLSKAEEQIAAGQFDVAWFGGSACAGQGAPPMNLFSTASGLTLSAAATGTTIAAATGAITAATSVALGAATMGAGLIIAVIGMIFAHHAAAVKRDLNFGCGALPAVNNAFSLIAQAVQNGQTTPDAAASSLDQIYSEFQSAGASGAINNHPWCNSNCEMGVILKGMILYWKSQYQAQAAQLAAAAAAQQAAEVAQQTGAPPQVSPGGSNVPAISPAASSSSGTTSAPAAASNSVPVWMWIGLALLGALAVG